jgi:hypothetical protein
VSTPQASEPLPVYELAPAIAFTAGLRHAEQVAAQIIVDTPDPYLNVMAAAAANVIDGSWRPPVFVHGAMQWNVPYPGWRTIFGATVLGWHERVKAEAQHYIAHQIRQSDHVTAKADLATLLTGQARESRYYGVGRIDLDQQIYDMQSQFFDQLVHNWRWTSDGELEKSLRPALELHLQWLRECFDPDRDGIYESYINTFPTDSVWYNGGGSVEATIYAYRGHAAARDMARRAHDARAVSFHTAMLQKIRAGFFEKLWIERKGHAGAYREQGGHQRLHEDAWLYSIFLPIDARDFLSTEQAAQSLRFTEVMLENVSMPLGGRTVYTSNWVPGIWSVRENYPGDNYHLALGYFQTGLAEDGWDILRGAFMHSGFGSSVPANFGAPVGTDFGDCVHMFARALVEGLFGYAPDYPNDVVNLSPQFPAAWDHASIKTPDMAMHFERLGDTISLDIQLTRRSPTNLRVPIRAENIASVTVDGNVVPFTVRPGFGQSIVEVRLPARRRSAVRIRMQKSLPQLAPVSIQKGVGEDVALHADRAHIVSFADPQSVLTAAVIRDGTVEARIAKNPGHHTVIAEVKTGALSQLRPFHIKVTDFVAEAAERDKRVASLPEAVRWEPVDISAAFNGDLRTIYQQQYLSPRPNTVSARIGTDGYSAWTFPYWKAKPPMIELDNVARMLSASGRLVTAQRVPFSWSATTDAAPNIAFTSLWDNWPDRVTVPVHKKGEAVFLLVAGSTNFMQCNIANAVIRLRYEDGEEDSIDLVPPINYWNLSPIDIGIPTPGQQSRNDYTSPIDAFAIPKPHPQTVQLGENARAMLIDHRLRIGKRLESVTLETLSQEVVVGLMGLTVMNPQR